MRRVKPSELTDKDTLGAVTVRGYSVRIWDDCFGPLWAYQESLGLLGVVRAETWEDAYDCCVDEIMDDADVDDADNAPDQDGNLPEGVLWRGIGEPSNPELTSPMASYDLNGNSLEPLTDELAARLDVAVFVEG